MKILIAADVHAGSPDCPYESFFQALESLAATDYDIIFLGDIFDLWIGIDRYETEWHRKFMDWCAVERKKRTVSDIRSPIIHEPEESEMNEDPETEKAKKPKRKRLHRKPRTDRAGINPETV